MSPNSTTIIILTVVYFILSAITTFDIRMIQARRDGTLPPDEPMLPDWAGVFVWINWVVFIVLLFLNWKYAILVFFIRFILKVLPVLEIIGNIIMSPFKKYGKNKTI